MTGNKSTRRQKLNMRMIETSALEDIVVTGYANIDKELYRKCC
ncbi:MAG: hypothetical protein ACLUDU_04970 [Butyricimonas faecihominis]